MLKKIKTVFIGLLLIAFFAFAISMTILMLSKNRYGLINIDGKTLLFINDKLSSENYKKGDLVILEELTIGEVKVKDELFIYQVNSSGIVNIGFGVVKEIDYEERYVIFDNGTTYSMDLIAGRPQSVKSDIGLYLSVIQSKWGFLFIILVPSFLLFLYQLYSLIVEIKYGD